MKRYQEASAPKQPTTAGAQAQSDVGTPSNKEAIAAQNRRIKERMESARLTPPKPASETTQPSQPETDVGVQKESRATPSNGSILKAVEECAEDIYNQVKDYDKYLSLCEKYVVYGDAAGDRKYMNITTLVANMAKEYARAHQKELHLSTNRVQRFARLIEVAFDRKWLPKLDRSVSPGSTTATQAQADLGNKPSEPNAPGGKPHDEQQGEVIDDGTYDEVRYQKTENGSRMTRSGIRIANEPISKSGLTDKQMGIIDMVVLTSREIRDANGDVIRPARKPPYPDYVMEMYNKQLPEYQARMAEKRKNAPVDEDVEFGLGGFINKPASGVDADGNPIVIGEEQVPEAIVPLANKPGNLLNRLGSKIKELLTKKTEEATSDASVHASEEAAGPLIDKLAAHVVDASGLGMPSVLGKIGKRMQNLFSSESTDTLSPEDAGAPSLFDRIKKGAIDFKDNLLAKPSEAVRSMLAAEETQPDLTAQQQSETTPAGPTTVEFKGAADMLKSQGAMTDQVKEMKDAALKLYTLLAEAFTQSGIKVQGIGELAQICAAGVASGQNGQPQPEVQVVPVPHEQDSGIDLRKRQA